MTFRSPSVTYRETCYPEESVRVPYVQKLSGVAEQTILVVLFFKTFYFILVDSQFKVL